jgi:peptide/nickel transport system substrate-binding protein
MEFDKDGDYGFDYLNSHSMGSGPYMIEEVALGERVTLVPNPNYSGPYPAKLSKVMLLHVPEATQQLFLLEKGDIDVATGLTAEQIDRLRELPGFELATGEDTAVSYLSLNMSHSPFDDTRVRRAVCAAVDYEGIFNDLLPNQVVPASGIIPRGLAGYTDDFMPTEDLELAQSLMAEAGYPDGFEFDLWVTTDPIRALQEPEANLGLKLQADLARVGIKANVLQQEISTIFPTYKAGELDSMWWDWSPSFADPDSLITPHGDVTTCGAQRTGWGCDPGTGGCGCPQDNLREVALEVTSLIEQARVELDPEKRDQLYYDAQKLIVEEGPYCFFFQGLSTYVTSDRVQGFARDPFDLFDMRLVSLGP